MVSDWFSGNRIGSVEKLYLPPPKMREVMIETKSLRIDTIGGMLDAPVRSLDRRPESMRKKENPRDRQICMMHVSNDFVKLSSLT
jgi:hypothetical protein